MVSRKKIIFLQDTRKRIQSSSSYFRKFAQDNIGRNFRRPEPKDEDAKKQLKFLENIPLQVFPMKMRKKKK